MNCVRPISFRTAVLAGLLLAGEARAQDPACPVPLDAAHVRVLVDAAHDALLEDDAEAHAVRLAHLRAAVPCLSELVPTEAWARLLYEWALVRHASGESWEELVTAALLAAPALERAFGAHEVRTYLPAPVDRPFAPPDDAPGRWYVDGREVVGAFALVGPHVLQERLPDGRLVSVLVEDGTLPASWRREATTDAAGVSSAPTSGRDAAVRLHVATGLIAAFGDRVEAGGAVEPATKWIVPVEAGVWFEPRHGFVRITGEFTPLVDGVWVYEDDGRIRGTPYGGGGALAGGGRIGVGHLGALAGLRDPSRAVFAAVGGVQVHRSGVRLEGRAGIHLATELRVEPAVAVLLAWTPAVWRR